MLCALAVSNIPRLATRVRRRFTRQVCTAHFASKVRIVVCIWILGRRQREYRYSRTSLGFSENGRSGSTEERSRVCFGNGISQLKPTQLALLKLDDKYLGLHLERRLNWKKHIFTRRKQLGLQLGKMYWQQIDQFGLNCEAQPPI